MSKQRRQDSAWTSRFGATISLTDGAAAAIVLGMPRATVVALAGRRIDPPNAPIERFPLSASGAVYERLKATFSEENTVALVVSAACGADLLALEAAHALGIRTRIVLPFGAQLFRETSVLDRPGDWGARFDAALARSWAHDDVVELGADASDATNAYALATRRIVTEAVELAEKLSARLLAVAAWEGEPRDDGDATKDFLDCASAAKIPARSVSTRVS